MRVLTAAEMREVDRLTTERFSIPGLLLMENAAARAAEAIVEVLGSVSDAYIKVLCGRGNNGGDGAAVARHLWMRGALVDVVLLGRIPDTTGDARTNFDIIRALSETAAGVGFREAETSDDVWEEVSDGEPDLYVDAIFGTGLTRAVEGIFAEAIELMNAREDTPLVALDLPSGLASDTAMTIGPHVRADVTVTFTAPKPACVLPPALFACGRVAVAEIGSPSELLDEIGSRLVLVEPSHVSEWLEHSRRAPDAHKGSVGSVLVVGGSVGKTGAASMAAEAALMSGTGRVTVACARAAQPILAAGGIPEVMTEALADDGGGLVVAGAVERILELAEPMSVVAIGPGLGLGGGPSDLVRSVVSRRSRPVVLDADALTALAPWPADLRGTEAAPIVVTPHAAEMGRIAGLTTAEVLADRVAVARSFAKAHGVIVVLKGARTVVAEPGGVVFVNPTGNAGMATGGSGDVLTGIIAGLIAQQTDDPLGATLAGVYLHGLAGDLGARTVGTRALMATDITAHLGEAIIAAGGAEERA